jgi:hypothetical protein
MRPHRQLHIAHLTSHTARSKGRRDSGERHDKLQAVQSTLALALALEPKIDYFRHFQRTNYIRIYHLLSFLSDAEIKVVFVHKEVWEAEEFWDEFPYVLRAK